MGLNGYQRNCGKRSGGLSSIALIEAGNVLSAVYDREKGVCSQVVLKEECDFAAYQFREGVASFSEEVTTTGGVVRVRHEIAFSLERPDDKSAGAVTELIRVSTDGMVAVVTTIGGVSFLVGYSEKLGAEQPLRVKNCTLTSGRKFADMGLETIVLVSEDCEKAAVYDTGTF